MSVKKADKILLTGGEVLDLSSGNRESIDIVILNGKIDKTGAIEQSSFQGTVHDISGNIIIPGLMDMHVHLREPGREDKETIATGCAAAMAGGFTAVACMPNTTPAIDTQEVVRFIKKKAEDELVDVYPVAAITKGRKGKEITEMAELVREGAVAFSDDGSPLMDTSIMRHAMEYASMVNTPIIDHCEDSYLAHAGHMNEGLMSTKLGIVGIPNAAEAVQIARDIELVRLTGSRVHIAHMSIKEGVELVRRAKEAGLPVTCEVTPHHLLFTEADLQHYDTHLKMNPPLRTAEDVAALEQGIKDGVVDVFASDHAPHTLEDKNVEFDAAPFGILGLETILGVILQQLVNRGVLSLEAALAKMIIRPREILHIPVPQIKEGEPANLSIFNPNKTFVYDASRSKSKSRNAPYDGMELPGVVWGVVNKGLLLTT
ncbi:dihydroorotase [candidate division KSB1 bacterium]|nr:dihydroorotase [candidate division KSB1 bacterium]RQW01439.1 MAG: dihydroorotase [candidate division KSB1 bacterium]